MRKQKLDTTMMSNLKRKIDMKEDLILDMRMVCVNQHKDNAETKHGYYNG